MLICIRKYIYICVCIRIFFFSTLQPGNRATLASRKFACHNFWVAGKENQADPECLLGVFMAVSMNWGSLYLKRLVVDIEPVCVRTIWLFR